MTKYSLSLRVAGALLLASLTQVAILSPAISQNVSNDGIESEAGGGVFPRPGKMNAITDVAGIEVGQYSRTGDGYLTGTTVVRATDGATGGVVVPGGWPGTINTDGLRPATNPQKTDAIFLNGGSYYGLYAYEGVMRWFEEHCEGLVVGKGPCDVDPLVAGAILFDLSRGGDFKARPDAEFGYKAMDNANTGPVEQGNFGAGTAARSKPFKGGVGTASIEYEDGLIVGAIIAVNAATAVNLDNCDFYARFLELGGEFEGFEAPSESECREKVSGDTGELLTQAHTAIAAVATNAGLSDAQTTQMASRGADGMVISIDTIHNLTDGDTIFAMSTDKWDGECTDVKCLERVYEGATKAIARATVHAVLNAESVGGMTSYCDTFEDACKNLKK